MKKPLVAVFAITLAATAALARTVSLDSIDGTAATVTVGPGDANETLRLAYGKVDGGDDFGAWDTVSASLSNVPAEGGTFNVTLPIDPLESLDSLCWRIVTAPPWNVLLDALYGNGYTYFDTAITNTSADTIELSFAVKSSDLTYRGFYGARSDASVSNISAFARNSTVNADFNNSDALTYRACPQFEGYAPFDVTVGISAAERYVDAFTNGVAVSTTSSNASTNSTACANVFDCAGSAYIFRINGQPGTWETANSGYGFVSCRIVRGGETIADMVPVLSDSGADRIYDRVRKCYLAKLGTIKTFGIGATNAFAQITGTTEAFHRSSTREITVSKGGDGRLKVTVAAGASSGQLVIAYGDDDAGGDFSAWDSSDILGSFGSGNTSFAVDFPAGWGDAVTAMRFFTVDAEPYIDSSGTQYIDTGWTNGSTHVVEMSFKPLALPSNASAFYGCRNAAGSTNISMFVDGRDFYSDFNNGDYNRYRLRSDRDTDYRYRMVNSAARRITERSQSGVVKSAFTNAIPCTATFDCAGSAYLFAANDMSSGSPAVLWSANGLPSIRFFSLRVWTTGGTLVSEILPVKVGGVAKVYDTVRDRYFENAGSGDFTYGMTVQSLFCVGDLITPQTKFSAGFMVIVR